MDSKTKQEKIKHLLSEKKRYEDKLSHLYKHYRGVIHESAQSEMTHTTVKVCEAQLNSIDDELEKLGYKE